jgi:hypothetical protein
VGFTVEINAGERVLVDGRELIHQRLEAAGQLAGGVVRFAISRLWFGPALVGSDQWVLSPS